MGKKKIILLTIVIGIFTIIALFSLAIGSAPSVQGVPTPTPVSLLSDLPQSTVTGTGVVTKSGIPKWNNYEGSGGYVLDFPSDWSASSHSIVGGGEMVIVRPNILPEGINYPEFIFESNPNVNTLDQKIELLKALGLAQSEVTVLGKTAIKLSGTVPFKIVGAQKLNEPVQSTVIFLREGSVLYIFKYQYEGAVRSNVLEEYFMSLVNSAHLSK